jgi:hypothetical protein
VLRVRALRSEPSTRPAGQGAEAVEELEVGR